MNISKKKMTMMKIIIKIKIIKKKIFILMRFYKMNQNYRNSKWQICKIIQMILKMKWMKNKIIMNKTKMVKPNKQMIFQIYDN